MNTFFAPSVNYEQQGINLLLELAQYSSSPPLSNDNAFLCDPLSPTSSEAIRCLANVCLLHESGRVRLASRDGLPEALMKSGEVRIRNKPKVSETDKGLSTYLASYRSNDSIPSCSSIIFDDSIRRPLYHQVS